MLWEFACKSSFRNDMLFTYILIGTLGVIFFAIFFREPPRIVKVEKLLKSCYC